MKNIKSKFKIKDFLKELPNGANVLDFHKVADKGFPINLLITQRGAMGKTTNIKLYLKDKFKENGANAIWLRNLVKDIENEQTKFLQDVEKPSVLDNEWWNDVNFTGSLKKNNLWLKKDNQNFIKFQSMNSAEDEKGSRVIYQTMVWDEFNVNAERVGDVVNKFDSLLHSGEDLVANHNQYDDSKLFIFGNFKSLNHPVISKMGVTHITNEITEIYDDNGNKLMLIIVPKLTEQQIKQFEKDNKNNWRYVISKEMGTADHSYFNANLYDTLNSVKRYLLDKNNIKLLEPKWCIHHKKEYYTIYQFNAGDRRSEYHILKHSKKDAPKIDKKYIYYFQTGDILEQGFHNNIFKNNLRKYLAMNLITFEDVISRDIFISSLK